MPFKHTSQVTSTDDVYDIDLSGVDFELREYDKFGRLTKVTDYKGQITGFEYDGRGQLAYKRYYDDSNDYPASPAETVGYTYDSLG